MSIFRDPEFERIQEEEWLNYALDEYRFSLYERLADIDQPIPIPEDVAKKAVFFHNNCVGLSIRHGIIKTYVLDHYGITNPFEQEIIRVSGAVEIQAPKILDLRQPLGVTATINIDAIKEHVIPVISKIAYTHFKPMRGDVKRVNTLIESLAKTPKDVKNVRKSKSGMVKAEWLAHALETIIAENRFNIKSVDLMIKFLTWVDDYIRHGSIHALSLITRLKAMTHAGNPIYSVEGE